MAQPESDARESREGGGRAGRSPGLQVTALEGPVPGGTATGGASSAGAPAGSGQQASAGADPLETGGRPGARASLDPDRSQRAGGEAPDPLGGRGDMDADTSEPAADSWSRCQQQPVLPPGQYVPRTLPVLHYGPIPAFHQETWDLKIFGATESGAEARLCWDEVAALPVSDVVADFHCVTKFTVPGVRWAGILASEVLRRYPPAAAVTHVMIWADFGYSANIRINDFAADSTMLATHRDSQRLTPEHGFPLRLVVPHLYAWKSVKWIRALEYLTSDRRGFWEERGYHNTADPWREQRYSYQETDGEGPPL